MSDQRKYLEIVRHYESCLERFGDTYRGVDWPNRVDAETRYQVMLDIVRQTPSGIVSLLDFGCGTSHLYEHILSSGLHDRIEYCGLDISPRFLKICRQKYPANRYYQMDVLEDDPVLPEFDYIVMNGVLTEKLNLTHDEMLRYMEALVTKLFTKVRVGLAVNFMSKQVDWERDDLFHLPFDELTRFLTTKIGRHFVIRHDYGLYEYTTYVYREKVHTRS